MDNRKVAFLLAIILLLLGLINGCSFVLSRDYLVITPHLENYVDDTSSDNLHAETYDELKTSILSLVADGIEEGIIRLYDYSGDAEKDAVKACEEILKKEPLGAYAVEYISSTKIVQLISYYEVTIRITYQRTPEQIRAIQRVDNASDFQKLLGMVYAGYESSLTVIIPWYYENQYNVKEILESKYDENPLSIMAPPSFTLQVYPDADTSGWNGWERIIEIRLDYPHTPEELDMMSKELFATVMKLLSEHDLPDDIERIHHLERILIENVTVLPDPDIDEESDSGKIKKDDSFTAYGALVNGSATSEGYALAMKALCELSGVNSLIVRGRLNGISHCWTMVSTENGWYHIDPAQNDLTNNEGVSLKTDTQMADDGYKWSAKDYPGTEGPEIAASSFTVAAP